MAWGGYLASIVQIHRHGKPPYDPPVDGGMFSLSGTGILPVNDRRDACPTGEGRGWGLFICDRICEMQYSVVPAPTDTVPNSIHARSVCVRSLFA
jgi:hypothetical protein